jgi:Protein of unknown function (DUF4242)
MPRYLVERTFPEGLIIPVNEQGAQACLTVVGGNTTVGVTWVHSYVTEDKKKTFCIYDGPDPESIRKAAEKNNLPIDRISKVSVLDPYFYK